MSTEKVQLIHQTVCRLGQTWIVIPVSVLGLSAAPVFAGSPVRSPDTATTASVPAFQPPVLPSSDPFPLDSAPPAVPANAKPTIGFSHSQLRKCAWLHFVSIPAVSTFLQPRVSGSATRATEMFNLTHNITPPADLILKNEQTNGRKRKAYCLETSNQADAKRHS